MTQASADKDDLQYGWAMVAITFFLTGLSFGGAGTVSVFILPLSQEFGWSRGQIAFGYTMFGLATIFGILWGRLADRYGARPLAIFGSFCMVGSLYLLSTQTSLIQYYALYFLFGAVGHAVMNGPLYSNVGFWFTQNKGLALGVASAGGAVGQAFLPFYAQTLILLYDWRAAYIGMAILYAVIAIPLALLVRESPVRKAARRAHAAGEPDTSPSFVLSPMEVAIWMCIAVIFCCTCMSVPIVHVIPLIADRGVNLQVAASVMVVLMIAATFGRVIGGVITDKLGGLRTYILFSFGQTVLVPWFPHIESLTLIYVFAAVYGLVYSGVMTTILVCVREMIPPQVSARYMAMIVFFAWIGMGFGGFQGGLAFDITGSYTWSFANGSIAGFINLAVITAFWIRIRNQSQAIAPQAA